MTPLESGPFVYKLSILNDMCLINVCHPLKVLAQLIGYCATGDCSVTLAGGSYPHFLFR